MAVLKRAHELGLVRCRTCGLALSVPDVTSGATCSRCRAEITPRVPFSTDSTLAWLIAGMCLYIPANVLPVMHTGGIQGDADSTILGGIIEFWRAGDWDIAALIFTASVAVPFTKFIALGLLVWSVRTDSTWQPRQRTVLYRVVELIGYWSMLDVIVVAITCALIRFQVLENAEPRAGIAFFCAVVIATMLSAQSFDPRLIWDHRARTREST